MNNDDRLNGKQRGTFTRRKFLGGGAAVAGAALLRTGGAHSSERSVRTSPSTEVNAAPKTLPMDINGRQQRVTVDPRTSLLDMLRDQLDLTGAKKGCDHGQCGACTVLIDGERVLSCLTLAVSVQGRKVETIESLTGNDGTLHPMQQAFIDHDGFQCGYCTPGQIMSAVGCVREGHAGSDAEIREYMSGNLCRCAAYPNIVKAITQARGQMERG